MKVGLIVLTLRGYSLIHTGEFDIMNNVLQWVFFLVMTLYAIQMIVNQKIHL